MVKHDNTYSRVIAWLKILLPLLALAILSTLFLVARTINPAQELPFADVDVAELAREQRVGKPNFSSVTDDGAAISLSAESARPEPGDPNRLSGEAVNADIDLPSGQRVNIASQHMHVDNTTGLARLRDSVVITTSDGFTLKTREVDVRLRALQVSSGAPTVVTAPGTTLRADRFTLSRRDGDNQPYVLVFKGHVKLVYDPNE